ncbi:MAG: hypothetical protein ACREJ3_11505, partial [Polyangiaceae bacterium]
MKTTAGAGHRRLSLILFSGLTLAAASGGCASQGSEGSGVSGAAGTGSFSALDGDAGSSTFAGDCPSGLESISISPPAASERIAYPEKPQPVTFTAKGTFPGGRTMDVTGCAAWSVSAPSLGSVASGVFTPESAGQFVVSARSGAASANATVTVTLTGTANQGNIYTTKLDGAPGGASPRIAYPLDGALFPSHFGDLAFQVVPSAAGQTLARVAFRGDAIDLNVYAPCTPISSPVVSGACSIALPADLEQDLAGVSEAPVLSETVRLAAADGSALAESLPIDARWSAMPLSGTIYYWSAPPHGMTGASEIVRMNLSSPGTPPGVYFTNLDSAAYASPLSGGWACVGCHAISRDGTKMGVTIGGSSVQANGDGAGSLFALLDVAKKAPVATRITESGGQQLLNAGFATLTTFSPDGANMVQELQGKLYSRAADATLASQGPLFADMAESLTQPAWSPAGDLLAFASWVPTLAIPHGYDSKDLNGNETPNAQIWTAAVRGATFGAPSLLVARTPNRTEYYPAISDDSALVVFNESSCTGPATPSGDSYGASPCDGYDDPSARLRLIAPSGGAPVDLDRASGRTSDWPTASTWTNSWPRFAPDHGRFQGKALYWIAFSSRRAYGATLAGSADGTTPPQIWFTAVAIDSSGTLSGDPSFSPVWLPMQNSATPEVLADGGTAQSLGASGTPTGNHIPQWVVNYVPYTP